MLITEFKNIVRQMVEESVNQILLEKKKKKKTKRDHQEQFVFDILDRDDDDKFSHADLAYALWPDMDKDSARSYFSKCIKGKRKFSNEDMTTLYNMLHEA